VVTYCHVLLLLLLLPCWLLVPGSRYVRPPIIVGDVEFQGAMTVREFKVAQVREG
jgi:methionine synthase II (cobalamin-independent)